MEEASQLIAEICHTPFLDLMDRKGHFARLWLQKFGRFGLNAVRIDDEEAFTVTDEKDGGLGVFMSLQHFGVQATDPLTPAEFNEIFCRGLLLLTFQVADQRVHFGCPYELRLAPGGPAVQTRFGGTARVGANTPCCGSDAAEPTPS